LSAAPVAAFIDASLDLAERGIDRGQLCTRPSQQRRDVLALEGHRGTLRIVLVVAAGRAVGGARGDRGEFALEPANLTQRLVTLSIEPGPGVVRLGHLRRLSLRQTIRSVGCALPRPIRHCEGLMTRSATKSFPVTVTRLPVTRCEICRRTVAYRPGQASAALTKHYQLVHKDALGAKPASTHQE